MNQKYKGFKRVVEASATNYGSEPTLGKDFLLMPLSLVELRS